MTEKQIKSVMNALEVADYRIGKYLQKELLKLHPSSSTIEKLRAMQHHNTQQFIFLNGIEPEKEKSNDYN